VEATKRGEGGGEWSGAKQMSKRRAEVEEERMQMKNHHASRMILKKEKGGTQKSTHEPRGKKNSLQSIMKF